MQLELFADAPFSVRLTIEEGLRLFWSHYWRHLPSAKTTKAHRDRVIRFFRGRYMDTITRHDVEEYIRFLASLGLCEATLNKALFFCSRLFTKLIEWKRAGWLNGEDFSKVQLPDVPPTHGIRKFNEQIRARRTTLRGEELDRLRYYADDEMTDVINMLIWSELRPSDLWAMTSANVFLPQRLLRGIQSKTRTTRNPGGVEYVVPLTDEMIDILLPRLARCKPGTPLFSKRNMQKRWARVRDLAGCGHVQMRDLRRTAASLLIDKGFDLLTVSESLGHTTTRMLGSYAARALPHQIAAKRELVAATK